jgi:hypothetical protein
MHNCTRRHTGSPIRFGTVGLSNLRMGKILHERHTGSKIYTLGKLGGWDGVVVKALRY